MWPTNDLNYKGDQMTYQVYTEHIGYCKNIVSETEDLHEAHVSAVGSTGGIMVKHERDNRPNSLTGFNGVLDYNDSIELHSNDAQLGRDILESVS